MPNIQVRNLGKGGIIRDPHATAAPLSFWTNGRNVLFTSGKTQTAPIWRGVASGLGTGPRFCIARTPANGYDEVVVARDDGSLARYVGGTIVEASEEGFEANEAGEFPWNGCFLGDVLHVNRADRAPRMLTPTATQFVVMPRWDASWRCRVLRQFGDGLIALNVTKAGVNSPTMVKVSDITYWGDAPLSWDASDPTTVAYENPLAQLKGPILDGFKLGDRFLFYSPTQSWVMRAVTGVDWEFRCFDGAQGIMGTNCILEIDNKHYVFGNRDIFFTDGVNCVSIADGRVKEWLYRTLNLQYADRCFVQYLPNTHEILFAGVSGDARCAWKAPTGCNSAAVYNLSSDTWSFRDLPNVTAMTLCNVEGALTWSTATDRTWGGIGGSWYDQEDTREQHAVAVNQPLNTRESFSVVTGNMLLGHDFADKGQLAFEVASDCLAPSFVERTGIPLDQPDQGSAPLTVDKEVQSVYPEATISRPGSIQVQCGAQMTTGGQPYWEEPQSFDPEVDYKVDTRASGRFLAIRFTFPTLADTELPGFDMDVVDNGSR